MHTPIDRLLAKLRPTRAPIQQSNGFTLTELLVVLIIGSIIVTTLLSLVNELLKTNQRETAKSETQRDMQMSLDYIAADLREAAYVYDPTCHSADVTSCPSYERFLPDEIHTGIPAAGTQNAPGSLAVLAFWKVDPLSATEIASVEAVNCTTAYPATSDLVRECDQVKRQKRSLTLVVYSQEWDEANSTSKWKGKSRIVRYELKKYRDLTAASATKFNRTQGYVDPLTDLGEPIFKTWPFNSTGTINCQTTPGAEPAGCGLKNLTAGTGRATGTGQVLSDFLDEVRPTSPRDLPNPICPSGDYSMGPRNTNVAANTPLPSQNIAANLASTSFFVCIRGNPDATTGQIKQPDLGEVQDIVVFLRGNAYGRARFLQDAYLPTLQTTVTLRGIINKNPN